MKIIFFLSVLFCYSNTVGCQSLKGKVIDAETKAPLPYVHVGILNSPIGTVCNEHGEFKIDRKYLRERDTLAFSAIGYQMQRYKIAELGKESLLISLDKTTYQLEEIVIKEEELIKIEKTVGRKNGRNSFTGSTEIGWGGELGIKIRTDGKINMIKDVNFKIMEITYDSVLFGVNVYHIQNGLPGISILKKPIYLLGKKGQQWLTKNLEDKRILFKDDIIVTVESIKAWPNNDAGYGVFYCDGKGYRSKTYFKAASMAGWSTKEEPRLTLFLNTQTFIPKSTKRK